MTLPGSYYAKTSSQLLLQQSRKGRGRGRGEGARTYEKILGFRTPSPSLAIARSTSPLWGEVKVGPFAPPLQRTPFPSGEREKCALIDAAVPIRNTPFGVM
jgi:hypothetical protein